MACNSCGCANSNSYGCSSCGCNSCGYSANAANTANSSGCNCNDQLNNCRRQLKRAYDVIQAIDTLADNYLRNGVDFNFGCNSDGCNSCGCSANTSTTRNSCGCNSCGYSANTATTTNSYGCNNSCGCNNYWGR